MKHAKWLMVGMFSVAGAGFLSADRTTPDGGPAFGALKTLQGTWIAEARNGAAARTTFELVADGSVLMEHYENASLPGGGHMVSTYYLDGGALMLTHYCIAKNQPTLRAERYDAAAREVQFEFAHATGLASPSAGHMRRARYRIEDADHFTTEWEFFENGKKTMTEIERFTRVK